MKKNRKYKKSGGFKDCSLIIIACEGEKTEPKYFSFFEQMRPKKCRVEILKEKSNTLSHNSAPKWILERVKKFQEDNQIGEGDFLFMVLDVDKWKMQSLHELNAFCEEFKNHFLIISNPCFEVWLYYHLGDPKKVGAKNSKQWKKIVHDKTGTGFEIEKFANNILSAATNAKKDDKTPNHFFPEEKNSKVYKILESLIGKIGIANFNSFIKDL